MKVLDIVEKLISLSPRQFEREAITKDYIVKTLEKSGVQCKLQDFMVTVPIFKDFYLKADGKEIECLPTCFKGGKITKKSDIISSIDFFDDPNRTTIINFNPHCDCISLANYYDSPALAVSKKDINYIGKCRNVDGFVKISKKSYKSCNILAGNTINPINIYFAHYDCFFEGAIDNASGVAVCMSMIMEDAGVLMDNLFVFCGAEELSSDKPDYWGRCFRIFESKNKNIMKNAKKIIVVDGVGTDEPEIKSDNNTVYLFFAKKRNNKKKIIVVTSVEKNFESFMRVYHSKGDRIEKVSEKYLQSAVKTCLSMIK